MTLAAVCEKLGAGEILLNSIDRDGTGLGFDLELIRAVKAAVSIPVIASSGAGTPEHFAEVFEPPGRGGAGRRHLPPARGPDRRGQGAPAFRADRDQSIGAGLQTGPRDPRYRASRRTADIALAKPWPGALRAP